MKTPEELAQNSSVMQNLLSDKASLEKRYGWMDKSKAVFAQSGALLDTEIAHVAPRLPKYEASLKKKNDANATIQSEIDRKQRLSGNIRAELAREDVNLKPFAKVLWHPYLAGRRSEAETLDAAISDLRNAFSSITSEHEAVTHTKYQLDMAGRKLKNLKDITKETELAQSYGVIVDRVVNHQAITTSLNMAQCAENCGTTLDKMVLSSDYAQAFAYGHPTREILDASIASARERKGNYKDATPEELAFRQFINQVVIPHQDYFTIYASKLDDLHVAGLGIRNGNMSQAAKDAGYPDLEILGKKPLSLSARKAQPQQHPRLPAPEKEERPEFTARHDELIAKANATQKSLSLPDMGDAGIPINQRLQKGLKASDEQLRKFDGIFEGIADDIAKLGNEKSGHEAQAMDLQQKIKAGEGKNEKLEDKIGTTEMDLRIKSLSQKKQTTSRMIAAAVFSIGTSMLKHSAIGAAAGSVVPAAGTAVGAGFGALSGLADGLIEFCKDTSRAGTFVAAGSAGVVEEARIKQEFIESLRAQKVDVDKYKTQIDETYAKIRKVAASAEMQETLKDKTKAERVIKAYIVRTVLLDGKNNTAELEQFAEEHGMASADAFLASFKGRTHNALERFCLGAANSNDMRVILAESNGLGGDKLQPHEQALKSLVEEVVKPHIGSYLTRASKMDKIYQSNLLSFGAAVYSEREMVRDASDFALSALFANEFGMSSVGTLDVRHHFDHDRTRHGGKYLYDTKVYDGKVKATIPPRKRVSTLPDEEIDAFANKASHDMAHASPRQPESSDMFLRVCGYEYFLPQAVRTAGVDNIFANAPEAPAAYPMVNAVIDNFMQRMSLGPIDKYREKVGDRLDTLLADTFIDFFAKLGELHKDDAKISQHRDRLHDGTLSEKYGPVLSSYQKRITTDATKHFDMFLDLYKHNLERTLEQAPETERVVLEEQIQRISEPTRSMLSPKVTRPDSHTARLNAAFEEHSFENMLRPDGPGRPR